jgi:hypothetical protein
MAMTAMTTNSSIKVKQRFPGCLFIVSGRADG